MALRDPLITSLLEIEPTTFHASDVADDTRSYAVNLSLECPSKEDMDDVDQEENFAREFFAKFLRSVRKVEFHLWRMVSPTNFTYAGKVPKTLSETAPFGEPDDMLTWLDNQMPLPPKPQARYWSTKAKSQPGGDVEVSVTEAGATDRLRAAQSWNAPVAHKFSLTHVVQLERASTLGQLYVVLPYFDDPGATPQPPILLFNSQSPNVVEVGYDSLGEIGLVECRTSKIGEGISNTLDPAKIDDMLTSEGYLKVDQDAANFRRATKWFEDRAASLMSAGPALAAPLAADGTEDAYRALFKSTETAPGQNDWTPSLAAGWYAAAALAAALDMVAIGVLKPISGADSEGEILAPLVTALLHQIDDKVRGQFDLKDPDKPYKARTVTAALRAVIRRSPLAQGLPIAGPLVAELRYVLDIKSAPDTAVNIKLLNALLQYHQDPAHKWDRVDADVQLLIKDLGVEILATAVAEVEQKLHDEAGVEAALIRFIETSESSMPGGKKLPTLIAENYLGEIGETGNAKLLAVVEGAAAEAWSAYRALLAGPFNGAEAVRRSASSEFTKAALAAMKYPSPSTSKQFSELVAEAKFYSERLLPATASGCFNKIATSLPMATFPGTIDQAPVRAHLESVYVEAVKPLALSIDPNARFIPDSAPHPLPIQIAANIDGSKIDEFGKFFNGIAVAVRRIDVQPDEANPWAHANLADLTWDSDDDAATNPDKTVRAAIHPMLPAVSDGRGPMFLEYEGFPFANTTFQETMLDNGGSGSERTFRPFYRHNAADYAGAGFELLPRLAYGRKFESFAFITSNAGTLPLDLQLKDLPPRPWMPDRDVQEPQGVRPELVGEVSYSRRTAIGQMALRETQTRVVGSNSWKASVKRRIGAPLEDVTALSSDYPRVGLLAKKATPGVRNVFREADGRGALVIGSAKGAVSVSSSWQLTNARWAGIPKRLVLWLFDGQAMPDDAPQNREFPFDLPQNADDLAKINEISIDVSANRVSKDLWEVRATVTCGTAQVTKNFSTSVECLWLRMTLESGEDPASLSFDDTSSHKPDGVDAPLLILAPDEVVWKDGLATGIRAEVQTPRVGYLDFERWFSNRDLRDQTFKPENKTAVDRLERALLAAYVMRHLDEELAASLDRLPDPAVEGVRIEFVVVDRLVDRPAPAFERTVNLSGRLLEIANQLPADPSWTPKLLKEKLFEKVDEKFKFEIEIASAPGDPSLSTNFKATLPPGLAARLSFDALVPNYHFFAINKHPEVIDPRMLQYASRQVDGSHFAFPSTAIRVETMLNNMAAISGGNPPKAIQLAADMIVPRPAERSRHYDIVTRPKLSDDERRRQWRLLGEIDVTSQRWRASGKPIYHYVKPRDFPGPVFGPNLAAAAGPALPLALDKDDVLFGFEAEAFFDRPDIDAQTVTKKLLPLPSMTVLQQHVWDAASATYFRHRFTLRSRYAGALRKIRDREVRAWDTNEDVRNTAQAWTVRVAMLADLSRILLTRPQLRAIIPLTTAPGANESRRPAPPLLCVLQEPPYARGGLADRIASEIKTGFGYGFAKEDEPDGDVVPVEILDSRKEIGPSPHLDYRPLDKDAASGMSLTAEGPIGLTFDDVNAPAPAFPNSMLVLSPIAVAGEDRLMEEHFLGISMRRYIDPAWTTEEAPPKSDFPDDITSERCWWFTFELPTGNRRLLGYKSTGGTQTLVTIEESGQNFLIKTMKAAVDGVAGALTHDVEIARLRKSFADEIVVLHQPIAPGRFSTTVLARPKGGAASTAHGRSNAPLMLAGFEWSPPKSDKGETVAVTLSVDTTGSEPSVRATIASAPTAIAWTKTNRDFDFVHTAAFDGTKFKEESARVTSLVARLSSNHEQLTFDRSGEFGPVWLCPSTFLNKYPVHVHRHLAVLTTWYQKDLGRPIEIYRRSATLEGTTAALFPSRGIPPKPGDPAPIFRPPENSVRVVEFETPAAILCGSTDSAVPETYKTAYFDLISTGFKQSGAIRLLFRFVGPPAHLRRFKKLTIALWDAELLRQSQQDPPQTMIPSKAVRWKDLDLKNTGTGQITTGLELLLNSDSTTSSFSLLRSDGTALSTVVNQTLKLNQINHMNPGLFAAVTADAEFWTDVSLLHSTKSKLTSAFDFGWLFSEPGGAEPAQAVAPEGLEGMIEAQARIVSVSSPIPIVSHG